MVMFFSRRIGLSDPNDAAPAAIPILGGTRLTGRIGEGYEIGLLNIQQRSYGNVGSANFSVARLRKNIFANSDIGFMITNKELQNSSYSNRVIGVHLDNQWHYSNRNRRRHNRERHVVPDLRGVGCRAIASNGIGGG